MAAPFPAKRGGPNFGLTLPAVDSYNVGWEGPELRAADKLPPETGVYDQSFQEGVELSVFRNSDALRFDWATFGIYADTARVCSFAAVGLPLSSAPTSGTVSYSGIVDGIAMVGSEVRRLFGSRASFTIDHATGSGAVRLELSGRGDAFGDFMSSAPASIMTATGSFSSRNHIFSGALAADVPRIATKDERTWGNRGSE